MIDCCDLAGDLLEPPIKIRRVSVQLVALAAGLLGMGSCPVERLLKLRTRREIFPRIGAERKWFIGRWHVRLFLSKTPHTPEPMWRASNRMLIMAGGGDGKPLGYTELERWTRARDGLTARGAVRSVTKKARFVLRLEPLM